MTQRGPRQGASVLVHTHVGKEQFDRNLTPPFRRRRFNVEGRVASLLTPWCAKGEVSTGVDFHQYSVRDHVSRRNLIQKLAQAPA